MALDSTALEINLKRSIKKYLIDIFETTQGRNVIFDTGLADPTLLDKSITEWLTFVFGDIKIGGLSDFKLDAICCTRGDNEGENLSILSGVVLDAMKDSTQNDGCRRIPLFDTSTAPWVSVGQLLVEDNIVISGEMEAPDETKLKILTFRLRWVAIA